MADVRSVSGTDRFRSFSRNKTNDNRPNHGVVASVASLHNHTPGVGPYTMRYSGYALVLLAVVGCQGRAPVAAPWQKPIPRGDVVTVNSPVVLQRLSSTILPRVDLDHASSHDVAQFLNDVSTKLEKEKGVKGVRVLPHLNVTPEFPAREHGEPVPDRPVTLHASDISLLKLVQTIADQLEVHYTIIGEEYVAFEKPSQVQQSAAPLPSAPQAGPSEGAR